MAITTHAVSSTTPVNASSITLTPPTNSVGDFLLLVLVTNGVLDHLATSSGSWTLLATANQGGPNGVVYVWWAPVTSAPITGTISAFTTASTPNRMACVSYSGAPDISVPPSNIAISGSSTATATPTAGSLKYSGGFAFWASGRGGSSSLSNSTELSSDGSWVAVEEYENAGSNAITVMDGPITPGTTATLSAAASASQTFNSVAISLGESQTVAYSGTSTFSGAGTLGVTPTPSVRGTATLSGAGTLSATGVGNESTGGTATLGGTGSLSASGNPKLTQSVTLSGAGTLSASSASRQQGSGTATLSGSGSLQVTGTATVTDPAVDNRSGTNGGWVQNGITANGQRLHNVTGYSVQEDATPLNAASTEGGVGTVGFAMPANEDSLQLFEAAIELDDDFRGTTSGTVTQVDIEGGINSITADSPLGKLVGTATANPMTGTFEQVASYYLTLGGVETPTYFDDAIKDILTDVPGWNGDVWLNLKQFCTANGVEVALVSNKIAFRPIRSIVLAPTRLTSISESLAQGDLSTNVAVTYNNNVWRENVLVYPRTVDETSKATVYSVEAGQVLEDDIQLSVSLSSIEQPICVDDVTQDYDGTQSVYSVRGVDNSLIGPTQWVMGGGKIELSINDDTTSVHIKITASSDQYYGPYRIAGRVYDAPDLTSIITPPTSTVTAVPVNPPTEPKAPTEPKPPATPAPKPTKPTKPVKKTAAEIKYEAAQAKYKKDYAAYKKAMTKYHAAVKAADAESARRQAEADAINNMRSNESDYPSLRIAGTGVHFDQGTLLLPTGVPTTKTVTDVGASVNTVFVDTIADAYTLGVYMTGRYCGEAHSIRAAVTQVNQRSGSGSILYYTIGDFDIDYTGDTIAAFNAAWKGKTIADFNAAQKAQVIDNFENQVFGNVAGARFQRGAAMFRIQNATTTNTGIDITAIRDTIIEDFNYVHGGQTIADFNAQYAGKTLKQFGRIPLLGG